MFFWIILVVAYLVTRWKHSYISYAENTFYNKQLSIFVIIYIIW